jgi:hypothetical protein
MPSRALPLIALLTCCVAGAPVQAQESGLKVALVIGNGSYASTPLKNPPNDARDVAAALERIGFRACGFGSNGRKVRLPVLNLSQGTINVWFKVPPVGQPVLLGGNGATTPFIQVGNSIGDLPDESIPCVGPQRSVYMVVRQGERKYLDDAWHMLTVQVDGKSNFIGVDGLGLPTVFIDGSANRQNCFFGTSTLSLGYYDGSRKYDLVGSIDDVRIYDRALSDSEIQALYHEGGWEGI